MSSDPDEKELAAEAARLADVVHGRLVEVGRTVAVAESLTGGLVASHLTTAPGTSVTFRGGLVVYSVDAKHDLAGVDRDVLDRLGAVHPDVARQLADGARSRLHADYGVGLTGVAGPGAQDDRPVGEVFVAVTDGDRTRCERYELPGPRAAVRLGAVVVALRDLIALVESARDADEP